MIRFCCWKSPIGLCTLPRQSQETNSPYQSRPCFGDYLAVQFFHSSPVNRLLQKALSVSHQPSPLTPHPPHPRPLSRPFELLLNTRSCANYSHFPLFVDECSKKFAGIKCLTLGHTANKPMGLSPKSFRVLKSGFLTYTLLTCQEYLRTGGI